MTLKFDSPRDAFLAVLSVVMAADEVGTMEERDFLFKQVKGLSLFKDLDNAGFGKLLNQVTGQVFDALPSGADGALTSAGIDELLGVVKAKLDGPTCKTLLQVAADFCGSDGVSPQEEALLAQMKRKLG